MGDGNLSETQAEGYPLRGHPDDDAIGYEEQLLNILKSPDIHADSESARFDAIWSIFNKLQNQDPFARSVFRSLSKSGVRRHQNFALSAFALVDNGERTSEDYERAVRSALRTDNYRLALNINIEATKSRVQTGCSAFLLAHALSHGLWNTAAQVWTDSFPAPLARESRDREPIPIYNTLSREMENYPNLPSSLYHLGQMVHTRAPVIVQSSGVLFSLVSQLIPLVLQNGKLMSSISQEGLKNLLETLRDLGTITPFVYFSAIGTLHKSATRPDKARMADFLYHDLHLAFPATLFSRARYGAMLRMHSAEGALAETYQYYLREFAKAHDSADLMAYHLVLTALARQGDVENVQRLFLELCQVHGRPKDIRFYGPLLYVHARLGDVQETEKVFRSLQDWGIQPNAVCWNILILAHSRSREPWGAFDVFRRMKLAGARPDKYSFAPLMGIHAKNGDTDNVLDILEQAQEQGVRGSYELLASLIQSHCLNDQADTAERVAEEATMAKLSGNPVILWNYLLRHYAFAANSKAVLRVQSRMQSLGVEPDDMTYAALMTMLVAIGKTHDAIRILRNLTLSHKMAATPFHYAIVLHGFAQEGNRDMATVIYHEMKARFPRIGASSRLAMLHLKSRRELEDNESLEFTTDFLAELLHEISTDARADPRPQPGLGRRRAVDAAPSIYFEHVATILAMRGKVDQADKILKRYESLTESSFLNLTPDSPKSIEFLTVRLMVSTYKHDWDDVESTWKQILERAIIVAARRARLNEPRSAVADPREAPGSGISHSTTTHQVEFLDKQDGFTFRSMIPKGHAPDSPLDRPGLSIIFAQRHLLEAPITRYLRSLDIRQQHTTAIAVVNRLEQVGFALTSKNWNFYLQMLTRSQEPDDWVLAYQAFEEKMIANTPPWPLLQSGKWTSSNPSESAPGAASTIFRRKTLEKRNPGQLMPTYTTAIHLATILVKANALAAQGDKSIIERLWQVAPDTCSFLRLVPHSKDRIQGVLLRGMKVKGDLPKRPRHPAHRDRSGVLGSKSPVDHVPVTELGGLRDAVRRDRSSNATTSSAAARTRDIEQAERYEGQIPRSPIVMEKKQRLEQEDQLTFRMRRSEQTLLNTLSKIRDGLAQPRTVSGKASGYPLIAPRTGSPGKRSSSPPTAGALMNPYDGRLEERAEAEKRLREMQSAAIRDALRHGRRVLFNPRKTRVTLRPPKPSQRLRRLRLPSVVYNDQLALPAHLPDRLTMIKTDRKREARERMINRLRKPGRDQQPLALSAPEEESPHSHDHHHHHHHYHHDDSVSWPGHATGSA